MDISTGKTIKSTIHVIVLCCSIGIPMEDPFDDFENLDITFDQAKEDYEKGLTEDSYKGGIIGGAVDFDFEESREYDAFNFTMSDPQQYVTGSNPTGFGRKIVRHGGKIVHPLNKDTAESLLIERHALMRELNVGLKITEDAIRSHGWIITGGMAIDFALRLKGTFLYDDSVIPDWDFFAVDFHKGAYDIANEILSKVPKDTILDVIGAMHPSTLRVRVAFTPVADCTYLPQEIFRRIPTVKHRGILAVHPHWQMIDQMMALSRPYSNRPHETVMHRWLKDSERYLLLAKHYPVKFPKPSPGPYKRSDDFTIPETALVMGLDAVIWHVQQRAKVSKDKIAGMTCDAVITLLQSWRGEIVCADDDFIGTANSVSAKKKIPIEWRRQFVDKLPRSTVLRSKSLTFRVYDNWTMQISAFKDGKRNIASLQATMLHLLTCAVIGNLVTDLKPAVYGWAFMVCHEMFYEAATGKVANKTALPTAVTYGAVNWSEVYIHGRQAYLNALGHGTNSRAGKPQNFYLKTGITSVPKSFYEFNPTTSPLFQFSGEVVDDPFVPQKLPE